MTPERLRQIEELFHSAREREPGEQAAFLATACGEDEELLGEVESLLASEVASSALLGASMQEAAEMLASQQVRSQLAPGLKLGPYVIEALLGSGGMGEVYRARDSRLRREVAIKVLPVNFARDPDRIARFEREARAASALNHPNIVSVYDIGRENSTYWIVSELVDGETLRRKIDRGPLPARKAIEIAVQIAEGLAAAHAAGIVHRDLKPGNIMFACTGRVKILDFGLAKVTRSKDSVPTHTVTLTSQTEPGAVLGTVGYMSPEQAKGLPADHRSDLFSFGAILYEMLSGKRAFQKPTWAETLSTILNEDPPTLAETTPNIPYGLQQVAERCLEKNPAQRFQSASDLAFALEVLAGSSSSAALPVETSRDRPWRRWVLVTTGIAMVAIVLVIFFSRRARENPAPQLLASILPPPGEGFWANLTQPAAISPNGVFLAIIAMRSGQTQLWVRRLNSPEAQPLAGTDGAANPFWSPDNRHIGFFANGKLKKVDVSGGAVSNICPTGFGSMGGTWSSRGVILFSVFADRLKRVSDTGGTPEPVSGLAPSTDALGQYWPSFLPDGKHFLYLEWKYHSPDSPDNVVWIGSLDGEKRQRLPLTSTNAEYSAGYLWFSRDGDLLAQRFDLEHLELRGPAQPVARSMQYDSFFDNAAFTVSNNGILVFGAAGTGVNSELTWMDRTGAVMGVLGEPNQFLRQSISPDAKHVAVGVKPAGSHEMVWIYDVERGTRIPLDPGVGYSPRWSWDRKQVAYRITGGKTSELYVRASDGSGEARRIGGKFNGVVTVEDWSPNSRYLVFTFSISSGSQNWKDSLQVVPVAGEAKPMFAINEAHGAKFAPDGNWLAYHDNTSGQVYVTRFPGQGGRIAVSSSGGGDPRWRGDGQELFYVSDDQTLVSVQVRATSQEFRVVSSRPLFHFALPGNVGFYDVTRDGKRFLVNTRTHKEQSAALTVVTNWASTVQAH